MRRIPIFIVIAAAIGGIVWWLFQGPKPAPPVIPATSAPVTIAQPESAPQSRPADRKITPTAFVESQPAESPPSPAANVASAADTITGVVRDDLGQPIRNASIDYEPQGRDARGTSRLVTSDKGGIFRIVRVNQDRQVEVSIKARCTGYEPSPSPTKAGWGSQDVALVLLRGRTVQIVVRDGDLGKPLERYGVRCFPAPSFMGRRSSAEGELRERGEHAGGVLELGGVPRGRQVLIVEPDGEDWEPSAGQEFEMTDSGAPRQDVTVWRNLKKTVRVKRQDGSPVAKSRVDLLRRISDGPIDQETHAAESGQLWMISGTGMHALAIAEGVTSDDGTVELAGPPRERLVLRALGPGHVPLVREVELTPAEGVIELVVLSGATLVGRLQPPEVLRELAGPDPPRLRPGRTPSRGSMSGVFLRHKTTRSEHPVREGAPLDADGTFRIEGVPAGAWDVHLRYPEPMGAGASTIQSQKIGAVDLVDGQECHESYDVSYLVKAEVEGVVTLDGQPLEDATVGFDGTRELADGEATVDTNLFIRLEPGGKFRMALFPADYRLVAHARRGKRSSVLHDDDVFRLAPGQKLARTFDLRSSVAKLRVMASDGVTPVPGIPLLFDVPKSSWPVDSEPTRDDGTVDVEGLPPGPIPVLVWPKDLSTDEARMAFMRRRPGKGLFKDALVPVTTITITPPLTSATIVLPASTGY